MNLCNKCSEYVIKVFAEKIAELQQKADKFYYEDKNQDMSSFLLDKVSALKEICILLGITSEVYIKAKKIYDFTNSGKSGYILKNGKIIKEGNK